MSEEKFKIGDKVKLKSDGPVMTIGGYTHDEDMVECDWFDSKAQHKIFHQDQLEKVDESNHGAGAIFPA